MSSRSVQAAGPPGEQAVREQLQRIVASESFASAPVLQRFLVHVVEHALSADPVPPKEYAIGVDVLGRGADFDPRVDTIVRVHERRLRARLGAYYAGSGRRDPVRIRVPKGHYAAEASWNALPGVGTRVGPTATAGAGSERPGAGQPPWPAVLPAPRTGLVGRGREVDALVEWGRNGGSRLLTLTGVGGCGKTRLGLAAASAMAADFPGGLWFVDLSQVGDGLGLSIARALGVQVVQASGALPATLAHLAATVRGRALLLLDNLEHLVAEARFIGDLLDGCAGLHVMATSRIPLHIYGEGEFPVPPLPLPAADGALEALGQAPAVELFVQRAHAANPAFGLDAGNAGEVVGICRMLDGLPLAIELVAAHAGRMGTTDMLARATSCIDLPARHVQDVPARQRTMRAAIEWSCGAVAMPAQVLFRRLSTFPGGFSLEAARAVSLIDGEPDISMSPEDALAQLVEADLVQSRPTDGGARAVMLETIRACAAERLAASGEARAATKAMATYCLVLVAEGRSRESAADRSAWLARCDEERANIHAAIDGMVEQGEGALALRLGMAAHGYWEQRELFAEGNAILTRVLDRFGPAADPVAWCAVAYANCGFDDLLGHHEAARRRYATLVEVQRGRGEQRGEAIALNALAFSDIFRADLEAAHAHLQAAQALWEALDDPSARAAGLGNLANLHLLRGEVGPARACLERAHGMFERIDDRSSLAWCLSSMGDLEREAGCLQASAAQYQRAFEAFVALGDLWGVARTWGDMGHLAIEQGRLDLAAGLFGDALRAFERLSHRRGVANVIDGCARLRAAHGDADGALRLAGAAEAIRRSMRMVVVPHVRRRAAEELAPLRRKLGARRADALEQLGAALGVEAAVALARRGLSRSG